MIYIFLYTLNQHYKYQYCFCIEARTGIQNKKQDNNNTTQGHQIPLLPPTQYLTICQTRIRKWKSQMTCLEVIIARVSANSVWNKNDLSTIKLEQNLEECLSP